MPDAATLTAGRQTAKDRGVEGGASEHEALADLAMLSPLEAAAAAGKLPPELAKAVLAWEYWDGDGWSTFTDFHGDGEANLRASGRFTFDVPPDWETCKVNGTDGHWLRARIVYGVFGKLTLVSWKDEDHQVHFMPIIEPRPPQLDAFRIGYLWKSKPSAPDHALTLDDFAWEDHTEDAAWRGGTFAPFRPVADATPALYLGFDGPLPADELGILFDVEEVVGDESGPALSWERWDGAAWRGLAVEDETGALAVPGIVHVPWPGDERPAPAQVTAAAGQTVTLADARAAARFTTGDLTWIGTDSGGELVRVAGVSGTNVGTVAPLAAAYGAATLARASLPRFGTPRTWLRARLRSDGDPRLGVVRGVYPNSTWAAQVETLTGELLGTSNGEPSQSFFLTRTPALAGEVIEVRELDGGRANVEYPLLVDALRATGIREQDLTVVRDSQTGHVTEVWVPWRGRPNLAFSGPGDRDYTIERTHGRILFGDGIHGRIPPAAVDGIRARSYRSGGGEAGNVPAAAIAQVLSGVVVAGVTNPRAAEGGAGSEPDAEVLARGPLTVRHRRQAVTAADYEALAFDASPAVAVARAATRRGSVTVTIVPRSPDPRPEPSFELRREVRTFLQARAPAAAGTLAVVPPVYYPVGVAATVVPLLPDDGGLVVAAARAALAKFLHPLTGGPGGAGWPFGRDVYLADLAALLEALDGVDHVEELALVVDGAPQGESVAVPGDRLVAAGVLDVSLGGDL